MSEIVCAAFMTIDGRLLMGAQLIENGLRQVGSGRRSCRKGWGLDVAVVRECQKEVGLTPRAFDDVAILYEDDDRKKRSPFHIVRVPVWDGGTARSPRHEHLGLGWFAVDELLDAELAFYAYRDVILPLLQTNQ